MKIHNLNKKQITRKFLKNYKRDEFFRWLFRMYLFEQIKYSYEEVLKQLHPKDSPNSFQVDWDKFVDSIGCPSLKEAYKGIRKEHSDYEVHLDPFIGETDFVEVLGESIIKVLEDVEKENIDEEYN